MNGIYSPKTVKELLAKYGLAPLKKLGQNFLCDGNVVNKIAELGVPNGANVIEVGPGLGALTNALSLRAKKVVSIEIDKGMVEVLKETLADRDNVKIIHSDFLKCDLDSLVKEEFGDEDFYICGNLPYYITGPIIMQILSMKKLPKRMTVMVQKELAQRISAKPGDEQYSGFTAEMLYFGDAELAFTVPGNSFFPQPDVDSAVIYLDIEPKFSVEFKKYNELVKALFAMRRKTVLNNIRKSMNLSAEEANELFSKAGILPTSRAEELSAEDFSRLAELL